MPSARTNTVKDMLVTWFETVLIPVFQPELRDQFAAGRIGSLNQIPNATPYLEDQTGALQRVIPSADYDWTHKMGAGRTDRDPDPWVTAPTYDVEDNQLTTGEGKYDPEWLDDPVIDANGSVVYGGRVNDVIEVLNANWKQAWRSVGFTVPADFPTTPITDGCPDPATGEWVNSIRLTPTDKRKTTGEFIYRMTMRIRYTVDDPDGAPGNRLWEVWEEYFWQDVTTDNGKTWVNSKSVDWAIVKGPIATARAETNGP